MKVSARWSLATALPYAWICALIYAWAVAAPPLAADEPRVSQQLIDEIQRECLRAYPTEMLREMAAEHDGKIPESVENSPEEQQEFLTATINLDKGLFYPFVLEDLLESFETYVKPGEKFLDLGSGDGRVVFLANAMGADATGIEYDKGMVKISKQAMETLGEKIDPERVHFIKGDFFKQSWSGYDVIFYFDLTSFEHHQLRQKISKELDPGARLLVGHQKGAFPGLALETTFQSIHVYRQPQASMRDPDLGTRSKKEVAETHQFLQDWYNGAIDNNDANFARISDVLTRSFVRITEEGRAIPRQAWLQRLRDAHGSWRAPRSEGPGSGKIFIKNLRIRLIEGPMVLLTFEEHHQIGERTRRVLNTALFQLEEGLPNNVIWYHLHQTALP